MTGKRFSVIEGECDVYDENYHNIVCRTDFKEDAINVCKLLNAFNEKNEQLKLLIKKVLETTPIEHSLALDLKNSIRELYK